MFPVSPLSPFGNVKSNTAAVEVPLFTTAADEPEVTVPTDMVGTAPLGIPKSNTAAPEVPLLTTVAEEAESNVVTVPT